jgi:release factor glutamine methyltransferase
MGVKIQTIKEIRFYLARELNGFYPESEINAISGIILRSVLNSSSLHNLALPETAVSPKQVRQILSICGELKKGKPLQYIMGYTNFYNCLIRLNNDTLIPRPETEELVDLIIKENREFSGSVLDIGTGSGCIAIALALNLPQSAVTGIDISDGALLKAGENAVLNKVRVSFIRADIFNINPGMFAGTDIVVSNPPYIRESEKKLMSRNVLDYEPDTALFVTDADPLVYYTAITKLASAILTPGGKIYFEINETMGKQIVLLLESAGYSNVRVIKDINGKDRIIKGIHND